MAKPEETLLKLIDWACGRLDFLMLEVAQLKKPRLHTYNEDNRFEL